MGDLAGALVRRGHRVIVYTARRAYDDPSIEYPARETLNGVEVRRLPLSSFGKQRFALRMLAAALFGLQCLWACLRLPRPLGILYSTSPPFIGAFAALAGRIRRVPTVFWIMDLVPDLLFASGHLAERSAAGRALEWLARLSFRTATAIIALDPHMRDRILGRGATRDRVTVIPPWSPEVIAEPAATGDAYRARHGLGDETVIMYSGNHSPMNPLGTVLAAAERLRDEPGIRFFFVGGGAARPAVEALVRERSLPNVVLAPSEPVERLADLLAAADVHVVTLGDPMVGIIHPCKVYGAMAAARPILYVGPPRSHVADLLDAHPVGWQCAHGDVDGVVDAITRAHHAGRAALRERGAIARAAILSGNDPRLLCERVADAAIGAVESARTPRGGRAD